MTPHTSQDQTPRGDLISELLGAVSRLVRGEMALARAEAARSMRAALRGAVFAAIAGATGLAGVGLLAGAGAAALMAWGLSPAMALLATAAIFLIVCLCAALAAAAMIRRAGAFPERSARNLSRDYQTLKAGVTSDVVL